MSSISIDHNLKQTSSSKLKTESTPEEKTFTKRVFNYIWSWIPCVGSYTHVEDVEAYHESEDDSLQHSENATSDLPYIPVYEESSSEEEKFHEWTMKKRMDFIQHLCNLTPFLIKEHENKAEDLLKSSIDEENSNLEQSSSTVEQLIYREESSSIILSLIDEDTMKYTKKASNSESREAVYTVMLVTELSTTPIYTNKIHEKEVNDDKYLSLKVEEKTITQYKAETLSKEDNDLDINIQTQKDLVKIELNTDNVRTNELAEKINEVYTGPYTFIKPTQIDTLMTNESGTSSVSSAINENIIESPTFSSNIEEINSNIETRDQKIDTATDNQSSIYFPTNHQKITVEEPKRNLPDRQFSFKELFQFYESKK